MKSHEYDMKIIVLTEIYNFVVDNFLIKKYLEYEKLLLIFICS